MRWIKTSPDTLTCGRLEATITRHPDRFVVRIGEHTREHYSLTGAKILAERMRREIDEFDHWSERRLPEMSPQAVGYRVAKLGKMVGRRALMAGTVALVAMLAAALLQALGMMA